MLTKSISENTKFYVKVKEMEIPYEAYETQNLPSKPVPFENIKLTLNTNVDLEADSVQRICNAILTGLVVYGFMHPEAAPDFDIDIVESDTYSFEINTW
jgi:hypothetical protein